MPQSRARLPIHLIFSTKNRLRSIPDELRDQLHRYVAGVINNNGCHSMHINSVEDHIHILFDLGRTVTLSKIVQEVKTATSSWIKTKVVRIWTQDWHPGLR
jgi:putative transposase